MLDEITELIFNDAEGDDAEDNASEPTPSGLLLSYWVANEKKSEALCTAMIEELISGLKAKEDTFTTFQDYQTYAKEAEHKWRHAVKGACIPQVLLCVVSMLLLFPTLVFIFFRSCCREAPQARRGHHGDLRRPDGQQVKTQ